MKDDTKEKLEAAIEIYANKAIELNTTSVEAMQYTQAIVNAFEAIALLEKKILNSKDHKSLFKSHPQDAADWDVTDTKYHSNEDYG